MSSVTLLTPDFLAKYPDQPEHQTPISQFVYLRTYSRYLPKKKRRENWKEICIRSVTYNVGLAYKHLADMGHTTLDLEMRLRNEAEAMFDAKFNLEQFLSGRTTFVGGSETSVADLYPLSNFNCSFTNIESLYDLCSLFYLLLIGTGVGFKCTPQMAEKLEHVRLDLEIVHEEYKTLYPFVKVDESSLLVDDTRNLAVIYIGDSKEAWVMGLKYFLDILTKEEYSHIKTLKFNYNYVREAGERLKRFGGSASGAYPLIELYKGIDAMLRNLEDPYLKPIEIVNGYQVTEATWGKLRPVHILSWGNRIGYGVVVGKKSLCPH